MEILFTVLELRSKTFQNEMANSDVSGIVRLKASLNTNNLSYGILRTKWDLVQN